MAHRNLEAAFLADIREHPDAASLWLILADWLEDQSDPRAELVRLTLALRTEPEHPDFLTRQYRVQTLLGDGMRPVVATIINSVGMTFALIPAGAFWMGSPDQEPFAEEDEHPRYHVQITRPYYLGVVPVTQQQYRRVMKRNPSRFNRRSQGGPTNPVESITYPQVQAFCRALSSLPQEQAAGRVYRLPTEAEWEYACRAGTTTAYHFGDQATIQNANMDTNDNAAMLPTPSPWMRTCPVGTFVPNAWGLYDLHGNVWEWTSSWFDDYTEAPKIDPPDRQDSVYNGLRTIRGGGWNSYPRWCRSARRSNTMDDTRDSDLGFRVVCEIPP